MTFDYRVGSSRRDLELPTHLHCQRHYTLPKLMYIYIYIYTCYIHIHIHIYLNKTPARDPKQKAFLIWLDDYHRISYDYQLWVSVEGPWGSLEILWRVLGAPWGSLGVSERSLRYWVIHQRKCHKSYMSDHPMMMMVKLTKSAKNPKIMNLHHKRVLQEGRVKSVEY